MDDASSQGADESERAKLASAAATQSVATLSPFRLRGCGCGCGCAPALFRTGAVRCVDSHSSAKSAKRRARPVGKKRRTKSTARPMPPDPSRPAPSARLRPCPPLPFAPAAAADAAYLPVQDGEASDAAEPDGATPERPQSAQKEAEAAGSESEEDWDAEPAPVRPADSRSSASGAVHSAHDRQCVRASSLCSSVSVAYSCALAHSQATRRGSVRLLLSRGAGTHAQKGKKRRGSGARKPNPRSAGKKSAPTADADGVPL